MRGCMRILFVMPYPPSRIRVRGYGFLTQLQRKHEVTVVTQCASEQELADGVEAELKPKYGGWGFYKNFVKRNIEQTAAELTGQKRLPPLPADGDSPAK